MAVLEESRRSRPNYSKRGSALWVERFVFAGSALLWDAWVSKTIPRAMSFLEADPDYLDPVNFVRARVEALAEVSVLALAFADVACLPPEKAEAFAEGGSYWPCSVGESAEACWDLLEHLIFRDVRDRVTLVGVPTLPLEHEQ